MKKFKFGLVLLALLMMFIIAGCQKQGASSGGAVSAAQDAATEISFTVMCGEQEFMAWEIAVDIFRAQNPNIKVNMENVPGDWEGYAQKLMTLIAAGTPPDTGRVGSLQMPQYSSMGQLTEISEYVKRDINMAEYDAAIFEQAKVNGGLYGLPVGVFTLVVFYNKDLFDAAGIPYPKADWNDTWTLQEFQEISKKLTVGEGPNKQYGLYANLSLERTNLFYYSAGADIFNDDGTICTLDSPEMTSTYTWLVDMIKEGFAPSSLQAARAPPSDQLFMSNKLGMYVTGQWEIAALSEASEQDGLRWGVAPTPMDTEGSKTVLFLDDYVIFSGSKHKEEAWKLISFLIRGEAEEVMAKEQAFGMLMHNPTTAKMRNDMFPLLSEEEKNVLFDSPKHAKAMYFTANWAEMLEQSMKMNDRLVQGEIPVAEGLKQLKATFDELNKANLK